MVYGLTDIVLLLCLVSSRIQSIGVHMTSISSVLEHIRLHGR